MADPTSFTEFLAQNGGDKPPPDAPSDFAGFLRQNGGDKMPPMTAEGQEVLMPDSPNHGGGVGHIINAFGRGAADGFGAERVGLSPETEEYLKKAGIFNDTKDSGLEIAKAFNEAIIKPAAVAANAAWRLPGALIGGIVGATSEVSPASAPYVRSGLEAATDPGLQESLMGLGPPGALAGGALHVLQTPLRAGLLALELRRARSLGVIGAGEEGWKSTVEHDVAPSFLPPETLKAEQEVSATDAEHGAVPSAPVEAPTVAPEQPAPDIHATARQIAPETFSGPQGYDAVSQQRDTFRRWLDELAVARREQAEASAPHVDEIRDLEAKIEDATPRLAKKYQARLDELTPERDSYVSRETSVDSPDMARIRAELQAADYRMRDLAPEVTAAYRRAQEQMPVEAPAEPAPAPAEPVAATETPPAAEVAPAPPAAAPAVSEAKPVPVAAEQPAEARPPALHIADDVAQKLQAAGRPHDEAQASAAIVAAHYEARAARFGGAKGTAEELYRSEAPAIRAGRQRATGKQFEFASNSKRGSIALREGGNVIALMKDADASTFMHETGHQWLEELMSDAKDEKAPADLTKDAQTVRDWLGAKDGEPIARAQHEKFARGFERYLMEGRAPSRELASVFAKFRDWLTKIYETVTKLRSPINDDIRDVFDRLITKNPERQPVMAPEVEGKRSLADIHEERAETTPPEHADAVADHVRSEADKELLTKAPEVHDEIGGRATSESAGNPPEGAGSDRDRAAGQPESGTAGGGEGRGAVGAGGGEAEAEGGGLRGGPSEGGRNSARGAGAGSDTPAGANEPFGKGGSDLVDKAGNIRLDNLGTPEDVNQGIRETAEQNDDFLAARRNVISDQETLSLADALGMDADALNRRKIGQAFNAEQVVAARKLLIQSATNVRDLAKTAADGNEAQVAAFAEALTRHRMIQEQVAGITAEAGRALRAFRNLGGAEGLDQALALKDAANDATGRTLNQLQAMARMFNQLGTPSKVSRGVAQAMRTGVFDWVQSLFVNNLISGPLTHAGYTVAGELLALQRAVGETGAAGLVGTFRSLTGLGPAERASLGEVPYQLYGMGAGAWRGIKSSWDAFKSNSVILPEEVQRLSGNAGQPVGRQRVIPNVSVGGVEIPVGTVIESPGRLVAALHTFNWTTFYTQSMAGQAFRVAFGEGLEGQALSARVAKLMQSPTDAMIKEGIMDANGGALMNRPAYDSLMGNVSRLTNWGMQLPDAGPVPLGTFRPLKFIDPFVQIQANVQKAAFGRGTPFALFSQTVRDDLAMKNGGAAFDRTAGKIIAGTSFMVGAGWLASQGIMNNSGPTDPRQSREWQRIHGMPHGLNVGNLSFDMLRLGPMGMQMSVAADLYHAASMIGHEDASKVSAELVHAFAQNVVDESFMRGPAEIMRAVEDSDRYGDAWIRNFAKSFVPFSVGLGQVARQVDPYSRQARTTMDAIKAIIPFESQTLTPRYDVWGEPVMNRGWAGTYYQHVANDPVDSALYNLGVYPSQPERKIRGVELSDQQYADFSRISGRLAKIALNSTVRIPGFGMLPPGAQIDMVKRDIDTARESARTQVMMTSMGSANDIVAQAVAEKRRFITEGKKQ